MSTGGGKPAAEGASRRAGLLLIVLCTAVCTASTAGWRRGDVRVGVRPADIREPQPWVGVISLAGTVEIGAVEDRGVDLGPPTSREKLLYWQRVGWSESRYDNPEGGDRATLIVVHTGRADSPRSPRHHYRVLYSLRPQVPARTAVVLLWVIVPLVALALWRGEVWRSFSAPPGSQRGAAWTLAAVVVFTLFALQAELTAGRSLPFLGLLGLVSVPASGGRFQRFRPRAVFAWWAAVVAWCWLDALLPGARGSWWTLVTVTLGSLLGAFVLVAHRGRCARRPGTAADALFAVWAATVVAVVVAAGGLDAVVGILPHPWTNKFSVHWLLLLAWCATLATVRSERRSRSSRTVVIAAVTLAAAGFAGSKTAVVAYCASLVVALVARRWPRPTRSAVATGTVGLLLAAPLLAGVPWWLQHRLPPDLEPFSARYLELTVRGGVWEVARRLVAEHPWRGQGLGASAGSPSAQTPLGEVLGVPPAERTPGQVSHAGLPGGHPHSLPLLVWLDLGLAGAVLVAALALSAARAIPRVAASAAERAPLTAIYALTVLVFTVNYPAWHAAVLPMLWIGAAVAGALLPEQGGRLAEGAVEAGNARAHLPPEGSGLLKTATSSSRNAAAPGTR